MTNVLIPSLPTELQVVPQERRDWLQWRHRVLHWRSYVHDLCKTDFTQRAIEIDLCQDDPAYFLVMYGCLYEPRPTVDLAIDPETGEEMPVDRPPGWFPWVPFRFQVEVIRWFQQIMAKTYDPLGRGDGILEKSRELGVSWLFCLLAAHGWLFLDDQTIMFLSSKADLVDKRGDLRTLFGKIRALTGVYDKVPATCFCPNTFWDGLPVRLPDWMTPSIVPREHDHVMNLMHPTKNNAIVGESTTSTAGTAARCTWAGIDEASKNPTFRDSWGGMSSVTFHRFAFSSASLEDGGEFRDMAKKARDAVAKGTEGPSYYRADWRVHPLRTDAWFQSEKARATDPYTFMREYEIDYAAGFGDFVYPYAQSMPLVHAPYERGLGQVAVAIDPGLRDPTAILWFQKDGRTGRYRLFEATTLNVSSAEAIAPILMGFPDGHPERAPFEQDRQIMEVMDTTWMLRQNREDILFVGDPYGDNRGGDGNGTFYLSLARASRALSEQDDELHPVHIAVRTKYDQGARYHRKRKESLTRLLPLIDIHDTPRGRHALEALKEMRYTPLSATRGSQNEPAKPVHSWGSHVASAAEYLAVHITVQEAITRMTSGRRQRHAAQERVA